MTKMNMKKREELLFEQSHHRAKEETMDPPNTKQVCKGQSCRWGLGITMRTHPGLVLFLTNIAEISFLVL
jgi:hypothetical protein